MSRGGSTSRALWDLLNSVETTELFKAKWVAYCKKANFPQMLQAYDLIAGLAEADADTAEKFERIVFLPVNLSREDWIKTYGRQPVTTSGDGADA